MFDHHGRDEVDLLIGAGAIEHDFAGAKFPASMKQMNAAGEARQEHGLFHGRIASAHDGDLFAAKEKSVASGAGGDAMADELALGFQSQHPGRSARGDDYGLGRKDFLARR